MKNQEFSTKAVQPEFSTEPESGMTETVNTYKTGSRLRKLFYVTSLAGLGLCFNACTSGYVATEPTYVESVRPARPSTMHIWVDGNWVYSRQNHNYRHNDGYWTKPSHGRTYIQGHWQSSPRGQYWVTGHWQR